MNITKMVMSHLDLLKVLKTYTQKKTRCRMTIITGFSGRFQQKNMNIMEMITNGRELKLYTVGELMK